MRLNDNLGIYSLNQPVFIFGLCKYSLLKFLALFALAGQGAGKPMLPFEKKTHLVQQKDWTRQGQGGLGPKTGWAIKKG